jgi:hypothetical protein
MAAACVRWKLLFPVVCLSKPHQRRGERVTSLVVSGIERQRLPGRVERLGVPAHPHVHLGGGGEGARAPGIDQQRRGEFSQRFVVPALQKIDLSELSMGVGVVRVDVYAFDVGIDGAVEVRLVDMEAADRFVQAIEAHQRIERNGRLELSNRWRKQRLHLMELAEPIVGRP